MAITTEYVTGLKTVKKVTRTLPGTVITNRAGLALSL